MRPVLHTDKNITSNLEGERIAMSFDEESLPHLMRRFIDLYQDREMAVLREYSCNAYDSHIQAGVTDPIEIELPNRLNPTLTIRDHGLGLSVADLRDIWSKYGASTKRDSDEVIGSFGLGSKSALTYTDQFTVQAVKDGKESLISISFNEAGIGELCVIAEEDTDKHNGVEIVIPTKWPCTFAEKASELFQWWPEGSVTVDGEAPQHFAQRGKPPVEISDGIYLQEQSTNYYDQKPSTIIMGGVPYPIEISRLGLNFSTGAGSAVQRVIAFLPIGTVEPVPAREGLTDTLANKQALAAVGNALTKKAWAVAQAEIDQAPTMFEALPVITGIKRKFPKCFWPEPWSWGDEVIPTRIEAVNPVEPPYDAKRHGGIIKINTNLDGSGKQHENSINWEEAQNVTWLEGFEPKHFNGAHRRRLNQWIQNTATVTKYYAIVDELPDSPLIPDSRVHSWEDVRTTKLVVVRTGATSKDDGATVYDRLTRTYLTRTYTSSVCASDIDHAKPIVFYCDIEYPDGKGRWATHRSGYAKPYFNYFMEEDEDTQFLLVAPSRRAKLERLFPTAVEAREEIQRHVDSFVAALSDEKGKAIAVRSLLSATSYATIQDETFADPEISEFLRLWSIDVALENHKRGRLAQLSIPIGLPEVKSPFSKYPLVSDREFGYMNSVTKQHAVMYLNTAYHSLVK